MIAPRKRVEGLTGLVVLVLVVLWIAVLAPKAVRRFRESSQQASIDDFHQQLHLLERAGPKLVEPAYRLASGEDEALVPADPADRGGRRPGLALLDEEPRRTRSTQPMVRTAGRRSAAAMRRARKRRRDVLLGALATAVLTGVLGAMHDLHLLWALTGVSILAIAGYVALVAYAQMLHADLQAAKPVPTGTSVDRLLSRSLGGRTRRPPKGLLAPSAPTGVAPRPPSSTSARSVPREARHAARVSGSPVPVLSSATPVAVRARDGFQSWEVGAEAVAPRHAASGG